MIKRIKLLAVLGVGISIFATSAYAMPSSDSGEYKLEQVVILSRHNLRSPVATKEDLKSYTNKKWRHWQEEPGELTAKGEVLETIMGQYFRYWLNKENLIKKNAVLNDDEVRIYSNSYQRTIDTAKQFSSGAFPTNNINIIHKYAPNGKDKLFDTKLTKVDNNYKEKVYGEINSMYGNKGLNHVSQNLQSAYNDLEKALDYTPDKYFKTDDTKINLKDNDRPRLEGDLKRASRITDGLILQYYEEPNDVIAGLGKKLTPKQWQSIGEIKNEYQEIQLLAPAIAVNAAHPLLEELKDELNYPNRKFSLLVGHDSNLTTVMSALDINNYTLANTIEPKTPIGSKLVISKWKKSDGQEYIALDLIYPSINQIRHMEFLNLNNPPQIKPLSLQGLEPNKDGLYPVKVFMDRLKAAINAYNYL